MNPQKIKEFIIQKKIRKFTTIFLENMNPPGDGCRKFWLHLLYPGTFISKRYVYL